MKLYEEEKYEWREWYKDDEDGPDVNDFETEEEYLKACKIFLLE